MDPRAAGPRIVALAALGALALPWVWPLPASFRGDWIAAPLSYGYFLGAGLTLAVLLFLPGYALQCFRPASPWARPERLPIPGLLLMAAWGLLLWVTRARSHPLPGVVYLGLNASLALALLAWGPPARPPPVRRSGPGTGWFYGAVVVAIGAYSVLPLPVSQEFYACSTQQERMVASPPDANIPFVTAAYFHAGYGGRERSDEYFGPEWSVTSRGPLVPFAIATGLNLYRAQLADPPVPMAGAWPASGDGYFVARIIGILTNACILLGADALLRSLGVGDGRRRLLALVWLSLAPVTLINVAFLWPKLLAGYFLLLAAAAVLEGAAAPTVAGWAALGYLSHPVAGLFFPALALLRMRQHYLAAAPGQRWRSARAAGIGLAARVLLFLSPWVAEKVGLRHSEAFLRDVTGDGNGFAMAVSLGSWLSARGANLWHTFVPLGFYFSDLMHGWISGPISPFLRWLVQYAKTWPAQLGFSFCGIAYTAVFGGFGAAGWRGSTGRFAAWFLLPAAVTLVVFWGFSRDGLGRDCLEPLTVLTILWTVACLGRPARWFLWLAPVLWIEGAVLTLGGIAGDPPFLLAAVTTTEWALAAGYLAASLVPLGLLYYWWPRLETETNSPAG